MSSKVKPSTSKSSSKRKTKPPPQLRRLSLFGGPRTIKNVVLDFSENTTSHGIPRIGRAENKVGQIFWILICIVCLALFIWQAWAIITRYLKYEKITQIAISAFERKQTMWEEERKVKKEKQLTEKVKARRKRMPKKYIYRYAPVYAHCYCPYKKQARECLPLPTTAPTSNDTKCICFYDRVRKTAWPCYPMRSWSIKWCDLQCELTGSCSPADLSLYKTFEKNDAGFTESQQHYEHLLPCVCQNISNYCIATSDKTFANLWETTTTTTSALTTLSNVEVNETVTFPPFESSAKDLGTVSSQAQDSMIFAAANLPAETISKISYMLEEFIIHCSFNQRDCNMEIDFKNYTDPKYGNCYIFNADSTQTRTSQRAGPMYGLSIVLFVNGDDYLPMTAGKGVRINIHPQDEYPFPDTFGYNAPPGFLTSFGIRLKKVERIPWPKADCVTNGSTEEFIYKNFQYSAEGCYRSCLQKALCIKCGCSDPMFPKYKNMPHCKGDNASARNCINMTKNEMGGLHGDFADHCTCRQPCEQTVYDITFSAAKWPHAASIANYQDICANVSDCEAHLSSHAVYLEIYYEQLNYELLRESQAYMLANLLSDFGGQLGLWMGISVITCFEFFVLIWDLLRLCCLSMEEKQKEMRRRRRSSNFNGNIYDNSTVDFSLKVRRNALTDTEDDDDDDDDHSDQDST